MIIITDIYIGCVLSSLYICANESEHGIIVTDIDKEISEQSSNSGWDCLLSLCTNPALAKMLGQTGLSNIVGQQV